jgi:hypothetical protein
VTEHAELLAELDYLQDMQDRHPCQDIAAAIEATRQRLDRLPQAAPGKPVGKPAGGRHVAARQPGRRTSGQENGRAGLRRKATHKPDGARGYRT